MRARRTLAAFVPLAVLWCAMGSLAEGAIVPSAEAAVRVVCVEGGSGAHPKQISLATVVPEDSAATGGRALLGALYQPDPFNTGARGRLSGVATRVGADGEEQRLATLDGKQSGPDQPIQVAEDVEVDLEPGEVILWDIDLKGFGKLEGTECVTVVTIVGRAE